MRKLSGAAVAIIIGVALYFTLVWGYDGLRMLTSPSYGLDDVWRSQFVFAIGSLFGLGPIGLIKLAAFFGALKLAVAGICAVHILDRLRALIGGKAEFRNPRGRPDPGGADQHRVGRPGGVVAERRTGARSDHPVDARRGRHRALPGRAQLRPPGRAAKPAVAMELAATPRGAPWFSPFR